jgi:hypothetical protein
MEEDVLQQIVYSIQSGLGEVKEESREFRMEAERQNFSMSKFMSDLSSKFFITQNKQQSDLNDSMDEVERQSTATNQSINELQSITQESVSLLSNISSQMKEVAQGIGSLVQLFQQSAGANEFSFGNMVGQGLGALVGGAAATAAIGGGLASLTDVGSAEAGQILPSGGGNSDTGGSGQALSVAEMVKLAKQAGFSDQEAVIMGAIGAAESSGNPKAHNPVGRDNSYGLWQINMLGGMGPERRNQFGIENNEQLWDPNINAKAARKVWEQQGFGAWSVYTNGAYKQYLGTAQESLKSGGENTNVEASKEEDGKVVNKPGIMNSMGSLNSKGQLSERKGFIIHHTGGRGDVGGVVNTLNQRGLSVQYVIDREGKIHQLMPSGSRASHMKKGQGVGAGLSNSNTEGVEIIAKDDSDVLPVQVEAAKQLATQLGYAPNQVYGHGEVNPHKQRTEGATVISAIRGGSPPANPSESQSASGSSGLSGEGGQSGGGGQMGGGESNPFAGTPFAGLSEQIAGALGSLTSIGGMGAGMLTGGGGIMGAALPMLGGLLPSLTSGISSIFSSLGNVGKLSGLENKSDAQPILQNDKTSPLSEMSNNLTVEKTVAELTKQEIKVPPVVETATQNRPVEGVRGPSFSPTPSSSIGWVDRLGGRNKFPKSFNINGVYSA